jgi:hypothetical protein
MIPLSIPEISVVIVYNDGASSLGALAALPINQVIGVHDPDDVAAGLILGATVTLAGYARQDPGLIRIVTRLGVTGCAPLVTTSRPGHPRHWQRRVRPGRRDGPTRGQTSPPCSSLFTGHRTRSGDR